MLQVILTKSLYTYWHASIVDCQVTNVYIYRNWLCQDRRLAEYKLQGSIYIIPWECQDTADSGNKLQGSIIPWECHDTADCQETSYKGPYTLCMPGYSRLSGNKLYVTLYRYTSVFGRQELFDMGLIKILLYNIIKYVVWYWLLYDTI